jgi:hypothetical protein
MDEGTIWYLCTAAPLLYLLSDLLPPPPLPNVQYIQTVCDCGGRGWRVLKCTVDHILQEFYTLFLTRSRTYKIASPPQSKMTSKDDIKGLVSLKFLRPCFKPSPEHKCMGPAFLETGMWEKRSVCIHTSRPPKI